MPRRRVRPAAPTATRATVGPPPGATRASAAPSHPPGPAAGRDPAPIADPARYLPGPKVGPPRKGRWLVTLPVGAAVVALTSAAPVLLVPLLAFVFLPALGTAGDLLLHHTRRTWGMTASWVDRQPPATYAGLRFGRNVLVGTLRALPVLGLLAVLVAAWYPLHDAERLTTAADVFLRVAGAVTALLLVVPALEGSVPFGSGVAVDELPSPGRALGHHPHPDRLGAVDRVHRRRRGRAAADARRHPPHALSCQRRKASTSAASSA